MKKFFEQLKSNKDVFASALSNGAKVKFWNKGETGSNNHEANFISETNAKYFNEESDVLLADFISLDFSNGTSARIPLEVLEERYEKGGWESVESLIISQVISAVNLYSKTSETIKNLEDYESFKQNLIVRPVNYDLNEALLRNKIYKKSEISHLSSMRLSVMKAKSLIHSRFRVISSVHGTRLLMRF